MHKKWCSINQQEDKSMFLNALYLHYLADSMMTEGINDRENFGSFITEKLKEKYIDRLEAVIDDLKDDYDSMNELLQISFYLDYGVKVKENDLTAHKMKFHQVLNKIEN